MIQSLLRSEIRNETDVVKARKTARDIARFLDLDVQEQTRVATAVSEIARNAFEYARGGIVEYKIVDEDFIKFVVVIKDQGPGIAKLNEILQGTYVSPQGMGLGIMGARKLMDEVAIETRVNEGTTVTLKKIIPHRKKLLLAKELRDITDKIMGMDSEGPMAELQRQNQEILVAMAALNEKKEELVRINQELEDTNRGVVALYAELDEKAEFLRQANESKTSFLSDLTHEFRSPLNSILGITQILLMEAKEEGAQEREKQVNFIVKAARGLSDMVNDLLDIAKIEAGKVSVRPSSFSVNELMSTLRGLMRPVGGHENVNLHFDISEEVTLYTDEAKLTQILRNLISNALKYTVEGEIAICYESRMNHILFKVKDTGIGIPAELKDRIFEEFFQVENEQQEKIKGTGLGLPLSRKLARLLGGELSVKSEVGKGSEFTLKIPTEYQGPSVQNYEESEIKIPAPKRRNGKRKVLVVDDNEGTRYLLKKMLDELGVDSRLAEDGKEGVEVAKMFQPDLVILDLAMPRADGMNYIRESMGHPSIREIPILLHTSKELEPEEREYLEQVTSGILKKSSDGLLQVSQTVKLMLGLNNEYNE